MSHSGTAEVSRDRPVVTPDRVAARAHELYVARGQEDGHDLADWLQAEAELLSEHVETALSAAAGDTTLHPRLVRARRPEPPVI